MGLGYNNEEGDNIESLLEMEEEDKTMEGKQK